MKTVWTTLERPLAFVGALALAGTLTFAGAFAWFALTEERRFRREWARVTRTLDRRVTGT